MEMNNSSNPLVSVVVLTYNSSATVLETLDSIKNQTYKNIELIITDDGSHDDTIKICKRWIDNNQNKFINTEFVATPSNTGISSNANRGVLHSKGSWLKLIAADDKLLPTCIEQNVIFIKTNPQYSIVFSKFEGFGNIDAANRYYWKDCGAVLTTFSSFDLKTVLYQRNFLPAVTAFYSRRLYEDVGGFEEAIPLMEDWPFWIKVLDRGYIFGFLDKVTAEYRFSQQSVSQSGVEHGNPKFRESSRLAVIFASNHLSKLGFFARLYKLSTYNQLSRQSFLWHVLHYLNILNPFYYHNKKVHQRFFRIFSNK